MTYWTGFMRFTNRTLALWSQQVEQPILLWNLSEWWSKWNEGGEEKQIQIWATEKKEEEEVSSLIYSGMFTFLPLELRIDWHIIRFEGARARLHLDGYSLHLAEPNPFINVSGGERACLHITARHIKPSTADATDRIRADAATVTSFFPCMRDEQSYKIGPFGRNFFVLWGGLK